MHRFAKACGRCPWTNDSLPLRNGAMGGCRRFSCLCRSLFSSSLPGVSFANFITTPLNVFRRLAVPCGLVSSASAGPGSPPQKVFVEVRVCVGVCLSSLRCSAWFHQCFCILPHTRRFDLCHSDRIKPEIKNRMRIPQLYSQVLTLFERYSALSPAAITLDTARQFQSTPAAAATHLATAMGASPPVRPTSGAAADVKVWIETARLLSRSGAHGQTVAMLHGMPLAPRAAVVEAVRREQWDLPRDVVRSMELSLVGGRTSSVAPHNADKDSTAILPGTASAVRGVDSARPRQDFEDDEEEGGLTPGRPLTALCDSPPAALLGVPSETLVRSAFMLGRGDGAGHQQKLCFEELHRRKQWKDLLQVVVNWQQRGLVAPMPLSRSGEAVSKEGSADNSHKLFDAVGALREALTSPELRTSSQIHNKRGTGTAPWCDAQETFPIILAECLMEPDTVERLLRLATSGEVVEVITALMRAVRVVVPVPCPVAAPNGLFPRSSPVTSGAARRLEGTTDTVVMLWKAVDTLLGSGNAVLHRESTRNKERLLSHHLEALQHTISYVTASCSATALSDTTTVVVSSTDSVCKTFTHYGAQVRFIGLPMFAALAMALERLGVGPPSALVYCMFMCLGDRRPINWTPSHTTGNGTLSSSLHEFLSVSPSLRWKPALQLLDEISSRAREGDTIGSFPVSSTHLAGLLSGLQSVSVVRTWRDALQCVDTFQRCFKVTPNTNAMSMLLLNLQQASWRRSFEVLHYYRHRVPPVSILHDLQLISVKHGAWRATLDIMAQLTVGKEVPSVSYLNILYCLYAAGTGGQLQLCLHYFSLSADSKWRPPHGKPFNEVTVALGAVALLDAGHHAMAAEFARIVQEGMMDATDWSSRGCTMVAAVRLLGLLHAQQYEALVRFLRSILTGDGRPEATAVALWNVLQDALVLQSMLGMDSLHAPIRLVYDTIAGLGAYQHCDHHHRTFETRQRTTTANRPALFIPHRHRHQRSLEVATALGAFVKQHERVIGEGPVGVMAAVLTQAGVGPDFLKASLL